MSKYKKLNDILVIDMVSKYTTAHKMIWIDLENPTRDEIRSVMDTYGLAPEVAEDLLDPTVHTRADAYDDFVYFVFHFPLHTHRKDPKFIKRSEEIDFVIGKNFIITIHYAPIEALVAFSKSFETDALLHHDKITKDSGSLFVHILDTLYQAVQEKGDEIYSTLTTYEEKIFGGKEKEMVHELSNLNRVLIYFREALLPHTNIISLLERVGPRMFGKEFDIYIEHIKQEYTKSERIVSSAKEYADELRQTNDSLLSTKQNEIMKTLTVVNFIILPLSVITGLFGMNVESTPLSGNPYDFWMVVLGMVIMTIISVLIFKKKNWL